MTTIASRLAIAIVTFAQGFDFPVQYTIAAIIMQMRAAAAYALVAASVD